jgi:hypothetical protein
MASSRVDPRKLVSVAIVATKREFAADLLIPLRSSAALQGEALPVQAALGRPEAADRRGRRLSS